MSCPECGSDPAKLHADTCSRIWVDPAAARERLRAVAWVPIRCDSCDRLMTRAESQRATSCARCQRSGLSASVAMAQAQAAQARARGYRDAGVRYGD